jgi:hypothetical protein
MKTDHATIVGVVRAAQRVLAESIDAVPPRGDHETVTILLRLLNEDMFNDAIDRMEMREGFERSVEAATDLG